MTDWPEASDCDTFNFMQANRWKTLWGVALAIPLLLPATARADTKIEPLELTGQTAIHDPGTIFKEGGRYYVFGTGPGLRVRASSNLVDWVDGPPVFPAPLPWTTNGVPGFRGHTWAPDLIRINGLWHLYYSVSTFGKQVSGIGLVTSPTLDWASPDYRWTDRGPVIQSRVGDPYNAIDPSVMLDNDGKLWMAYGSFWKGIYLVELEAKTGLRRDTNVAPTRIAWNEMIEAVCLVPRADYYYVFVNWGQCCKGTNSTYEVRVGRSKAVTGPYLDREGKNLVERGGTMFLETTGRFIGPGHIGVLQDGGTSWFSYHYYDGDNRGRSKLALGRLEWTSDGWPVAKSPVRE
jgi:arabinan endo-1,5-alpha-L-arabinosidase